MNYWVSDQSKNLCNQMNSHYNKWCSCILMTVPPTVISVKAASCSWRDWISSISFCTSSWPPPFFKVYVKSNISPVWQSIIFLLFFHFCCLSALSIISALGILLALQAIIYHSLAWFKTLQTLRAAMMSGGFGQTSTTWALHHGKATYLGHLVSVRLFSQTARCNASMRTSWFV